MDKKRNRWFYFFLGLSILILVLDHFGVLKPFKGFFEEKLVIPIRIKFTRSLQPKSLPSRQAGLPAGKAGLNPLNSCQEKDLEIANLKTQIANLKEENLSARRLLGAPLPSDWKFLPVRVIGWEKDEIIIDKGEKDGIVKGMGAVTEGNFLGKVENLSPKVAKIKLLSSPESKQVVKIIEKENLILIGKGLLLGKGEGKMEIKEILPEEEIKEGDLVVIPFESSDLPVGKVGTISYQKGDVFKTAQVKMEINVRVLETVFLIVEK